MLPPTKQAATSSCFHVVSQQKRTANIHSDLRPLVGRFIKAREKRENRHRIKQKQASCPSGIIILGAHPWYILRQLACPQLYSAFFKCQQQPLLFLWQPLLFLWEFVRFFLWNFAQEYAHFGKQIYFSREDKKARRFRVQNYFLFHFAFPSRLRAFAWDLILHLFL